MRKIVIPMKGRMMHSVASELTFQPYGKDDAEVIHSISRAELNIALMNAAESQGVKIYFQQRCTGIDLRTGALQLRDERSGEDRTLESSTVIGCDGSASALRSEMLKLNRFNFSQQYLDYGYKEPNNSSGLLAGNICWKRTPCTFGPRGNYMLIALAPISTGHSPAFCFCHLRGRIALLKLTSHSFFSKLSFYAATRFPGRGCSDAGPG